MNDASVIVGKLSGASELLKLMERVCGADPFFYGEMETSLTDPRSGLPAADFIDRFNTGRAFGASGDLQWRRRNDGFDFTILCDQAVEAACSDTSGLLPGKWSLRKKLLDLIGTSENPVFPGKVRYPGVHANAKVITCLEYVDESSGCVQFTRIVGFGAGEKV